MTRRIAVFYASTGASHRTAADALCGWCRALCPESEALRKDLLDYVPMALRACVASSHFAVTRRTPWLWDRLYRDTDAAPGRRPLSAFWNDIHRSISKTYVKRLFSDIDALNPHAILTTHFLGMSALLDKWEHRTPIYFVGTDYATHSLQRDPRFDGWFVGSAEAARQHRADNIPTSDYGVKDFGIPLSRDYTAPPTRREARRMLGIDEGKRMVTVMAGAYGIPRMDTVIDSMVDFSEWRVEIICSEDARTYEHMRDKYYPFRHITVRDCVQNTADYYAASDVIAINPNGVRIAEAAAVGAAMLLLDPLPGLERLNCDYVLERGAARRVFDDRSVGEQISELLESGGELGRMRSNAKALSRPEAGKHIILHVMERLDMVEKNELPKRSDAACGAKRGPESDGALRVTRAKGKRPL
ncbi:MAG: hypothetical protein LBS75_05485 [Synergistaceae bacterium]|jgi:processive 1,2-diacylglycerol beta-glucosyltransferase|nr:hypothetical protein [Synergistaceae bacterium]